MLRTMIVLPMLALPLTGCSPADVLPMLFGKATVISRCPHDLSLEAPPEAVTAAIRPLLGDPEVDEWVGEYARHLDNLEACKR